MLLQKLASRRLSPTALQELANCPICHSVLVLALSLVLLSALPAHAQQDWTWVSGAKVVNQAGVYTGTVVPGARGGSDTWVDSSGNLWLFGGGGYDSAGKAGDLNDLWEFTPSNSQWQREQHRSDQQRRLPRATGSFRPARLACIRKHAWRPGRLKHLGGPERQLLALRRIWHGRQQHRRLSQ
jgi:hypothetical protein